jgi:hypothetical protein
MDIGQIGLKLNDFFTNIARGLLGFGTIQDKRQENVQRTGNHQGVPRSVNNAIDLISQDKKGMAYLAGIVFLILLIRR